MESLARLVIFLFFVISMISVGSGYLLGVQKLNLLANSLLSTMFALFMFILFPMPRILNIVFIILFVAGLVLAIKIS